MQSISRLQKVVIGVFAGGLLVALLLLVQEREPLPSRPAAVVPSSVAPVQEATATSTPHEHIDVPILVYHHIQPHAPRETANEKAYTVAPEALQAQLALLAKEGFHSVSFADLFDAFDGKKELPSRPVLITFDDGLLSQSAAALPILKKEGFTATFFIYTGVIGHKTFMTWEDVDVLKKEGMEIGGHGYWHEKLTKANDTVLAQEVVEGKKMLETHLDAPVTFFAYPFGLRDDRVKQALANAGYRGARTITHGLTQDRENPFEIHGAIVTDDLAAFRRIVGLSR